MISATVIVAGTSSGGSGYLRRILELQANTGAKLVNVDITPGDHQVAVNHRVLNELTLLNRCTRYDFVVLVNNL